MVFSDSSKKFSLFSPNIVGNFSLYIFNKYSLLNGFSFYNSFFTLPSSPFKNIYIYYPKYSPSFLEIVSRKLFKNLTLFFKI